MKKVYICFLTAAMTIFPSVGYAKSHNTGIYCGDLTVRECMKSYARQGISARRFQDNYDPRMKSMLAHSVMAAEYIERINELKDNPKLANFVMKVAVKRAHDIAMEAGSIDMAAMGTYMNRVIGTVLDEGVKVIGDVAGFVPHPKAKAIALITKIKPGAENIYKAVVTDFPKVSVKSPEGAAAREKDMRETFKLLRSAEEKILKSNDKDIKHILGTPIATFENHSGEITDEDIMADPLGVQIMANAEAVEIQNGTLYAQMNTVGDRIKKEINQKVAESAKDTQKQIEKSTNQLKELAGKTHENQDLIKKNQDKIIGNQSTLLIGQQKIQVGIAGIKYGQKFVIEGVSYLQYRELERQALEELRNKNPKELREFAKQYRDLNDLEKGGSGCAGQAGAEATQGVFHFNAENHNLKSCIINSSLVAAAEDMADQMEYNDRIELAQSSIQVFGDLGIIFNDPNLSRFASDAAKGLQTFKEIEKAINAFKKLENASGLVNGLAGAMTGIGALTTAVKLFMPTGPSAEQIMIDMLKEVLKKLDQIHKDMMAEFNAVKRKLDQMALTFNNSLVAHNRVTSDSFIKLLSSNDLNFNKVLDKLRALKAIEENQYNFYTLGKEDGLIEAGSNFAQSKNIDDLTEATRKLFSKYKGSLYRANFNQISTPKSFFPFSSDQIFSDYSSIIDFSAVNKANPQSTMLILSLLLSLDKEGYNSCGRDLFRKVFQDHLVSQRFLDSLTSGINLEGQSKDKFEYALEAVNLNWLENLNTIDSAIKSLSSTNSEVAKCLGLDSESSKNSNDFLIVENLFKYYQNQLEKHATESQRFFKVGMEAVMGHLHADTNIVFPPTNIFNGQAGANRPLLNDDIIRETQGSITQLDDKFVAQKFKAYQRFGDSQTNMISRCFPADPNLNSSDISQLPFPSSTANSLISDNNLKLAMLSELDQWNWCFEVGNIDPKTKLVDVFLVAKKLRQGNKNDKTDVKGIWKIQLNINEDGLFKYKKLLRTTKDLQYKSPVASFRAWIANKNAYKKPPVDDYNETWELVNECKPFSKGTERITHVPTFSSGFSDFDDLRDGGNMATEPLFDYWFQTQECLVNIEQAWKTQVVDSDKALANARSKALICGPIEYGQLEKCGPEKRFQEVNEEAYNKTMDFVGKTNSNFKELEKALNIVKISDKKKNETYKKSYKSGFMNYFMTIRNAYDNCMFASLKGEYVHAAGKNYCLVFGKRVPIQKGTIDLVNLNLASKLLQQLPDTLFIKKPQDDKKNSQPVKVEDINLFIGNLLDPAKSFTEVENLYNSGFVPETSIELVNKVIEENKTYWEDKVLPTIKKNYKFDRSILGDPETVFRLQSIKAKIEGQLIKSNIGYIAERDDSQFENEDKDSSSFLDYFKFW